MAPVRMVERLLDSVLSMGLLVVLSPLCAVAAIGIKWSSPGPILYRARRIGRDRRRPGSRGAYAPERRRSTYGGREFTLYKFRTMHVGADNVGPPIAAQKDDRIFRFGAWLRATKIDELPQLVNVIRGDMAIVGPRPEDPLIVRTYYTPEDLQTLQVLPGLTSPGTLYYYTHAERRLAEKDVVAQYVRDVLPTKLTIDRKYIQRRSLADDLCVVANTGNAIFRRIVGRRA